MPAKNDLLLRKIKDINQGSDPKLLEALGALIAADPSDLVEFRAAIKLHVRDWGIFEDPDVWAAAQNTRRSDTGILGDAVRGFGTVIGGVIPTLGDAIKGLGKAPESTPVSPEAYFTSDDFLQAHNKDASYQLIHAEAVKKRIELGIAISDESVLLSILKWNGDACRAYLASKFENIKKIHGWDLGTVPPMAADPDDRPGYSSPNNKKVLTDDVLQGLRRLAAEKFLLAALEKANIDTLDKLVSEDLKTFKDALEKDLGFPPAGLGAFGLTDESALKGVWELIGDKTNKLHKTAEEKAKAAFDACQAQIESKPLDAIAWFYGDPAAIRGELSVTLADRGALREKDILQLATLFDTAIKKRALEEYKKEFSTDPGSVLRKYLEDEKIPEQQVEDTSGRPIDLDQCGVTFDDIKPLIEVQLETLSKTVLAAYESYITKNNAAFFIALLRDPAVRDSSSFRRTLERLFDEGMKPLLPPPITPVDLRDEDIAKFHDHLKGQLKVSAIEAYQEYFKVADGTIKNPDVARMTIEEIDALLYRAGIKKVGNDFTQGLPTVLDKPVLKSYVDPGVIENLISNVLRVKVLNAYRNYVETLPTADVTAEQIADLLRKEDALLLSGLEALPGLSALKDHLRALSSPDDRRKPLKDALANDAFAKYEKHINSLTPEQLADKAVLLKDKFLSDLPAEVGDKKVFKDYLSPDQVKQLQTQLIHRLLLSELNKNADAPAADYLALVTSGEAGFKEGLKKLIPKQSHHINDMNFTPQMMGEYQEKIAPYLMKDAAAASAVVEQLKAALHGSKDGPTLENVYKTQTLEQFRTNLKTQPPGVTQPAAVTQPHLVAMIPELNQTQMQILQNEAIIARFENQLEAYSKYGFKAHPKLREVFAGLKREDKIALLDEVVQADKKNHPGPLYHILNAEDPGVLKHYLRGISDVHVSGLQQEKSKNDSLKGIHNAAVAKILAGLMAEDAAINIDVKGINEKLLAAKDKRLMEPVPTGTKPEDLSHAQYRDLVKAIASHVSGGVVTPAIINQAFGLDGTGAKVVEAAQLQRVHWQHVHNEALFSELFSDKFNADVIDVLLRAKKDVNVEFQPIYEAFKKGNREGVLEAYQNVVTTALIGRGAPAPTEKQAQQIKNAVRDLARELTPEEFRKIKSAIHRESLKTASHAKHPEILRIQSELDAQVKSHKAFESLQDKFEFVKNFSEIHIHNPLFQSKAPEMRKKFVGIVDQCDVMIDKLRTDYEVLKAHVDNLKALPTATAKGVKELLVKLEAEQNRIEKQLQFYVDVKDKINVNKNKEVLGILDAIDSSKNRRMYYDPTDIYTYTAPRPEKLDDDMDKSKAAHESRMEEKKRGAVDVVGTVAKTGNVANFMFDKDTSPGEVRYVDMRVPVGDKAITGRFTHDTSGNSPTSVTSKGKIIPGGPGRIEVQKFPSEKDLPEGLRADNQALLKLERAKVKFGLTIAVQLLANMDEPPTKDNPIYIEGTNPEQVKYIWAALALLGKEVPRGKRFDADAICVLAGPTVFDPDKETGFLGRFTSDSVVTKVFGKADHEAVVKEAKINVNIALKGRSEGKDKTKEAESQVDAAAKRAMKEDLKKAREAFDKRKITEGEQPDVRHDPKLGRTPS